MPDYFKELAYTLDFMMKYFPSLYKPSHQKVYCLFVFTY